VFLDWFPNERELIVHIIEASNVLVVRILASGAIELCRSNNGVRVLGSRDDVGLAPEL
jgi:hypothetical protein